jgi:hypothetical protein
MDSHGEAPYNDMSLCGMNCRSISLRLCPISAGTDSKPLVSALGGIGFLWARPAWFSYWT